MRRTLKEALLNDHQSNVGAPSQSRVFVDEGGDFVEFFANVESYRSEYVNSTISVYRSRKTNQIIGGQICGIEKTLQNLPGLRVEIIGARIMLSLLFTASMWTSGADPDGTKRLVYEEAKRLVNEIDSEVEITC